MLNTLNIERIKRLLLIMIGVMAALMAYYIWAYNQQKQGVKMKPLLPEKIASDPVVPDVVVNDVDLTETSANSTLWTLHAKEARIYSSLKETRLKTVEVEFFDEHGEKSLFLTSERGIKDDNSGNIIASGNVRVRSLQKDATLKTNELIYDANQKIIRTDEHEPVIIEQGDIITSGYGLVSDLSLSRPRILRDVTTSFAVQQDLKQGDDSATDF
ncbi:MAG: LPS export ABC transporter periplasmic protein LptC [Candidatus Vecturithrix sp.]|jgi:LPS export ABC transporter protein LptC|nr:LPS export ABC transporter periplasmic protein LptC [Candidatus Vecturithrix sp.]